MCLAVPGKVVEILDREAPFAAGMVEFAGIRRKVNLTCAPDAQPGEYVLVHAGIAIAQINELEAERVLLELASIGASENGSEANEFLTPENND